MKAAGSLCAEAEMFDMQFAEQKEFSLPCTHVEDAAQLANRQHGRSNRASVCACSSRIRAGIFVCDSSLGAQRDQQWSGVS
jgi:hypothetical protein